MADSKQCRCAITRGIAGREAARAHLPILAALLAGRFQPLHRRIKLGPAAHAELKPVHSAPKKVGFLPRTFFARRSVLQQEIRTDPDIEGVFNDVLRLTKLKYHCCRFADGMAVTLKFADAVGGILISGPVGGEVPLPSNTASEKPTECPRFASRSSRFHPRWLKRMKRIDGPKNRC
jgi:hypothetical protein